MPGDAVSSGFGCISRRFSAGLVGLSQGKSTQKCSQRRRKCASGILETHSKVKDIIPDDIPIVGVVDDMAVLMFALKVVEPEINTYRDWRGSI